MLVQDTAELTSSECAGLWRVSDAPRGFFVDLDHGVWLLDKIEDDDDESLECESAYPWARPVGLITGSGSHFQLSAAMVAITTANITGVETTFPAKS